MEYNRDDGGRFAVADEAGKPPQNANKPDGVGQERRKIGRESKNADTAGKALKELRAARQAAEKKPPVNRKR